MIGRRAFLAASVCAQPAYCAGACAQASTRFTGSSHSAFAAFIANLKTQARAEGIRPAIVEAALSLDRPNQRILRLDRTQPEFTLTWKQYRLLVMTERKIQHGRSAYQEQFQLLSAVQQTYKVDPRIVISIWGLESDYGSHRGSFGVVDALATLAFNGRRGDFFYSELISALHILQHGDIDSASMLGSYAGAMGQPQFMPSSYLHYAIDYDGNGRRDIWSNDADVLASISNYLLKNGWIAGTPWGQSISLPADFNAAQAGRNNRRSLDAWMRLGVRRADGAVFSRSDVVGAVLLPDGLGAEAFMVYSNFDVIRRYNPSDFYSLSVGLLGNAIA